MTLRMLQDAVRKAVSNSAGIVRRGGFEKLTTDCERCIGSNYVQPFREGV
jgi:hypothetical protein